MTAAPRAHSVALWARLLPLAVLLPVACHRDIRLLPGSDGGAGIGFDGAAGAGTGGAAGTGGTTVACSGLGPSIMLPTASGATCAAALETRAHRFALCACDAVSLGARLRTDAYDSRDSTVSDDFSAAVGINGGLQTTAELRAGGAIYVADATGVVALDHVQAGASFESAGPLAMLSSNANLLADASVGGDVSGSVQVSGTLLVPSTANLGSNVQANAVVRGPVSVTPPCDCDPGFADVAGAIASAAAANGDAAAGFTQNVLATGTTAASLDLPCGTFYLTSIEPQASLTLAVHGHALLAVAGDVRLSGGLTVTLDPSAELDLLVGGWLATSGGATIGAPAAPVRFRIWIAGSESMVFDGQPTIAAVIHAPNAAANASSGVTVSGSLFVKSLSLGDDAYIHYDRAILEAGVGCGEPAATAVP